MSRPIQITVNNVVPNDTSRSALQINFGNTSETPKMIFCPTQYPQFVIPRGQNKNYFVLTSKEAYNAKKEKQAAKIKEEAAKEEKAKKRKDAKEKKEMLKTVKEKVA